VLDIYSSIGDLEKVWIDQNPDANLEKFLEWLRWRYGQPDLLWRFPNGF
jgi:hypothetical protein